MDTSGCIHHNWDNNIWLEGFFSTLRRFAHHHPSDENITHRHKTPPTAPSKPLLAIRIQEHLLTLELRETEKMEKV